MRKVFSEHADVDPCFLGVSYDRYTDLLDREFHKYEQKGAGEKIRIGLLGVINPDRRDYGVVVDALKKLSPEDRTNLEFVTLGACFGGAKNEVVRNLAEYVCVTCQDGLLSAAEFDRKGVSCDFLISPLTRKKEYGTFNGSGSFGDAVYLQKRIIIPAYVDEGNEFEDIAAYYRSSEELSVIFRNLGDLSKAKVRSTFYEQFTTKNVYKNLVRDLRLCQ